MDERYNNAYNLKNVYKTFPHPFSFPKLPQSETTQNLQYNIPMHEIPSYHTAHEAVPALYHLLIHPNILQDVNGEYPAMESDKIMTTKGDRYTVFSLWDTYRNVHQLLTYKVYIFPGPDPILPLHQS